MTKPCSHTCMLPAYLRHSHRYYLPWVTFRKYGTSNWQHSHSQVFIAGLFAKFWDQRPKNAGSNEWFGIFASSFSSSLSSTSSSSSSSSLSLLLQLCVHTLVQSLESLHQRCSVNTRQKHSSQDHSFQNAHDARKQSNNYVVEEKEV